MSLPKPTRDAPLVWTAAAPACGGSRAWRRVAWSGLARTIREWIAEFGDVECEPGCDHEWELASAVEYAETESRQWEPDPVPARVAWNGECLDFSETVPEIKEWPQ